MFRRLQTTTTECVTQYNTHRTKKGSATRGRKELAQTSDCAKSNVEPMALCLEKIRKVGIYVHQQMGPIRSKQILTSMGNTP